MTTNKRLDAIRQRLASTTDGEWVVIKNDEPKPSHDLIIKTNEDEPWTIAEIVGCLEGDEEQSNAEFIANSKQDIAYLLSLVEKKDKALDIVRSTAAGNGHTALYELAQQALKCDEGGEVE